MKASDTPPSIGNHWEAAGVMVESRDEFSNFLSSIFPEAQTILSVDGCDYLRYAASNYLDFQIIFDQNTKFSTAYPYLKLSGPAYKVTLNGIREWEDKYEAELVCSFNGAQFSFFDLDYNQNKDQYCIGEEYEFLIGGLAYKVENSSDEWIVHPAARDKPVTLGKGFSALLPAIGGIESAEFAIKGPVLETEAAEVGPYGLNRFRVTACRPIDESGEDTEFVIDLFCIEAAAIERPQVDDGLFAVAWLQGRLITVS